VDVPLRESKTIGAQETPNVREFYDMDMGYNLCFGFTSLFRSWECSRGNNNYGENRSEFNFISPRDRTVESKSTRDVSHFQFRISQKYIYLFPVCAVCRLPLLR
jgi:hypothetical protein